MTDVTLGKTLDTSWYSVPMTPQTPTKVNTQTTAPSPSPLLRGYLPMLASREGGQLALRAKSGWIFERKLDGMRGLVLVNEDSTEIFSRPGNLITRRFWELHDLHNYLPPGLYDGELYFLRPDGSQGRREVLERNSWGKGSKLTMRYELFDVLTFKGQDVCGQPWKARRNILESLPTDPREEFIYRVSEPVSGSSEGRRLVEATKEAGHEGVVAKREDSIYLPGERSAKWRKIKHY